MGRSRAGEAIRPVSRPRPRGLPRSRSWPQVPVTRARSEPIGRSSAGEATAMVRRSSHRPWADRTGRPAIRSPARSRPTGRWRARDSTIPVRGPRSRPRLGRASGHRQWAFVRAQGQRDRGLLGLQLRRPGDRAGRPHSGVTGEHRWHLNLRTKDRRHCRLLGVEPPGADDGAGRT